MRWNISYLDRLQMFLNQKLVLSNLFKVMILKVLGQTAFVNFGREKCGKVLILSDLKNLTKKNGLFVLWFYTWRIQTLEDGMILLCIRDWKISLNIYWLARVKILDPILYMSHLYRWNYIDDTIRANNKERLTLLHYGNCKMRHDKSCSRRKLSKPCIGIGEVD